MHAGQGGMTWTALQIGKIIQQHGFSTAVVDEAVCASSCALIWLAGKERFMAPTSRIGFHASSTAETAGVEVSSYSNAVIGAEWAILAVKANSVPTGDQILVSRVPFSSFLKGVPQIVRDPQGLASCTPI